MKRKNIFVEYLKKYTEVIPVVVVSGMVVVSIIVVVGTVVVVSGNVVVSGVVVVGTDKGKF